MEKSRSGDHTSSYLSSIECSDLNESDYDDEYRKMKNKLELQRRGHGLYEPEIELATQKNDTKKFDKVKDDSIDIMADPDDFVEQDFETLEENRIKFDILTCLARCCCPRSGEDLAEERDMLVGTNIRHN